MVFTTFWLKLIFTELFDNSCFLNPDGDISLNIFEAINPTGISNKGKFIIISQAKLLVSSTVCLKLILTELFDTTRGFMNPDGYTSLHIFETNNPRGISNRGKFMIISQAKLLVPSTFWLKLIITELFERNVTVRIQKSRVASNNTTRGF